MLQCYGRSTTRLTTMNAFPFLILMSHILHMMRKVNITGKFFDLKVWVPEIPASTLTHGGFWWRIGGRQEIVNPSLPLSLSRFPLSLIRGIPSVRFRLIKVIAAVSAEWTFLFGRNRNCPRWKQHIVYTAHWRIKSAYYFGAIQNVLGVFDFYLD